MLNLHCEMCLLAGPKNGCNNTFFAKGIAFIFSASETITFNVTDSNTFEVIKLIANIWSCRFLAKFVSTAVWETIRSQEAAVPLECVAWCTHGFSPIASGTVVPSCSH